MNTQITGSIPMELCSLTTLVELCAFLPRTIKCLPCDRVLRGFIKRRDLNSNQLIGSLPAALGSLASLQTLCGNYETLCVMPNEYYCALSTFTNFIDDCLHRTLNSNQLSGTIPAALASLANLQYLCGASYFSPPSPVRLGQH